METWSIDSTTSLLEKMRHDRELAISTWNKEFPPNVEVDVVEDAGMTTTYGIWETPENIFIIAKSKNGYHPESRISLSKKVVEAIRSLTP